VLDFNEDGTRTGSRIGIVSGLGRGSGIEVSRLRANEEGGQREQNHGAINIASESPVARISIVDLCVCI
jgi:hypothetical protein